MIENSILKNLKLLLIIKKSSEEKNILLKFLNDKRFDIENKITNTIIKYLKDKEKINLKIEKVIIFNNIKLNSFTIQFLRIKNYDYSIVGVFSNEINYQLSKLILFHIYVSIINLKNKINFEIDEKIFFTLYYEFVLYPLIKNFQLKCYEIFKKKTININNNFEYNTTLLIDLNTKKILINLISLRRDKKYFKMQNESQMFIEILYHSTNIQIEYNNENKNSINLNLDKFYVKFDCRSTYPRQTYIIRFIPFLNGLSLVHVFTQNKLSRPQDCINKNNNNINTNNKCNTHRNSEKNNNKIKLKNIDDIHNKRRNSDNNNNNKKTNIKNHIKSSFNHNNHNNNNNNNNNNNVNDNIKLITSTNNTNKNFGAPNISMDQSISNLNNCYYKDINVIYGYEFFEQKQIFLDNKESLIPEQIKIIENFIIEYFIVLNYEKEDYYQTNINYNLKYFDNKIFKNVFDEEIYNKYKNTFDNNNNNNENFINEIKKKLILNLLEEISNEKNNFLRNNNNNNNLLNNIYRKDSNNSTNEKLYLLSYQNYLKYFKEFCIKFNKIFDFSEENLDENKENINENNNNNNENEENEENIKINNEINVMENISFINRRDSLNIFRKESLNSNFDGSLFSLDISNSMVKNNNFNKNLLTNLNLNNVNTNDLNELLKLNLTNIKNTEDSMIENNSIMFEKKNSNNSINNNININSQ